MSFVHITMTIRHVSTPCPFSCIICRMDILAARLKTSRRSQGLTQRQLAELVGTDQSHISRLEKGEKGATTQMLTRIARALGLTLSELLGDEVREPAGNDYAPDHPVCQILADYHAPPGLRHLALDRKLTDVLRITAEEWHTLRSVRLPGPVTKEGYVQLLFTVRSITQAARNT